MEVEMKLPRRRFLQLLAGTAVVPAMARRAAAQTYPVRPVHLISGFPAGGPNDIVARLMGQWLAERLGQQFAVENRPGAGSNIAAETVVRAAPDGYTLLMVATPNAINATLYKQLNFDFMRDIAPVGAIVRVPNVMVVHPSVPARSIPEFIAYAKGNPGKLVMASPGNGSSGHLSGELFRMLTGLNLLHVPYRGGAPAMTDLIAGRAQVYFSPLFTIPEFIKAGTLRGLAVTALTRSEVLPDVPALCEFVPNYEASTWFGIGAPHGTPAAIVGKLNAEINAGLDDPKIRRRLVEQGGTVLPGSPAEFAKLIADETEKWGKVVKFAGAKLD
jgi:tripartite-type tricarboxylate transporter receptor subunit TctC